MIYLRKYDTVNNRKPTYTLDRHAQLEKYQKVKRKIYEEIFFFFSFKYFKEFPKIRLIVIFV